MTFFSLCIFPANVGGSNKVVRKAMPKNLEDWKKDHDFIDDRNRDNSLFAKKDGFDSVLANTGEIFSGEKKRGFPSRMLKFQDGYSARGNKVSAFTTIATTQKSSR